MTAYDIMEFANRPCSVWAQACAEHVPGTPCSVLITDEMILASGDGKDKPSREGTFAEAIDESLIGLRGVLEKLSGMSTSETQTKPSWQFRSSDFSR